MLFWGGALTVFALDQITKLLVHLNLSPNQTFFLFTYVQNRGAAFGLFQGKQILFAVAGALVACLIIYFHYKFKSSDPIQLPLGLMLGGSAGNLIDRLTRGYVVDFIDFRVWPVFNVADTCLNVGIGLLIIMMLFPHPPRRASGSPLSIIDGEGQIRNLPSPRSGEGGP